MTSRCLLTCALSFALSSAEGAKQEVVSFINTNGLRDYVTLALWEDAKDGGTNGNQTAAIESFMGNDDEVTISGWASPPAIDERISIVPASEYGGALGASLPLWMRDGAGNYPCAMIFASATTGYGISINESNVLVRGLALRSAGRKAVSRYPALYASKLMGLRVENCAFLYEGNASETYYGIVNLYPDQAYADSDAPVFENCIFAGLVRYGKYYGPFIKGMTSSSPSGSVHRLIIRNCSMTSSGDYGIYLGENFSGWDVRMTNVVVLNSATNDIVIKKSSGRSSWVGDYVMTTDTTAQHYANDGGHYWQGVDRATVLRNYTSDWRTVWGAPVINAGGPSGPRDFSGRLRVGGGPRPDLFPWEFPYPLVGAGF